MRSPKSVTSSAALMLLHSVVSATNIAVESAVGRTLVTESRRAASTAAESRVVHSTSISSAVCALFVGNTNSRFKCPPGRVVRQKKTSPFAVAVAVAVDFSPTLAKRHLGSSSFSFSFLPSPRGLTLTTLMSKRGIGSTNGFSDGDATAAAASLSSSSKSNRSFTSSAASAAAAAAGAGVAALSSTLLSVSCENDLHQRSTHGEGEKINGKEIPSTNSHVKVQRKHAVTELNGANTRQINQQIEKFGATTKNSNHNTNGKKQTQQSNFMPFSEECLKHDTYNGITIDVTKIQSDLTCTPEVFGEALQMALNVWKEEGRRGIWIQIPTSFSYLIPVCTNLGFDFQFAERGHVVLTYWLPEETESRLPHGPTHQVGVGALVLHPRTGKMLVVQEKSGPAAARKLWKMPTGLTDPGEDIADAAIREVKEETGLDCVFDKIVCFRQAHGGLFNRSDMFFVCLLRLSSMYEDGLAQGKDIELAPQEEEIASVDWVDMDDYFNQELWQMSPLYQEMNNAMLHAAQNGVEYREGMMFSEKTDVAIEGMEESGVNGVESGRNSQSSNGGQSVGFVGKKLPVGFRPGTNTLYVSKP